MRDAAALFSHTGTHMDAPFHLLPDGPSLDALPPSQFFEKALVVDCTSVSAGRQITTTLFAPYAELLPQAAFVLFFTGWTKSFISRPISKDSPFRTCLCFLC
ncbi:MAG: cyclase family protein, partial [Oscillospiraceae bacterium]|nr:cyclase family protein [Oscillospiraceae bacterium]